MFIKSIKLYNYKSFLDSPLIQLSQGINIIVGSNNSGKTSLLEALAAEIPLGQAHKSLKTLPSKTSVIGPKSIEKTYSITPWELAEIVRSEFRGTFILDRVKNTYDEAHFNAVLSEEKEILLSVWRDKALKIKIDKIHEGFQTYINSNTEVDSTELILDSTSSLPYYNMTKTYHNSSKLSMHRFLPTLNREYIYMFKAQRYNVGYCKLDVTNKLLPDASNLPVVLNKLRENRNRYDIYVQKIKEIFPSIQDINIEVSMDGTEKQSEPYAHLKIMIWMHESSSERADLAIPLSECGTGISQVLAMMYVIVNSDFPKVIIIDEPNSFLHPKAINSLLDIFKEYNQHQYIIATHSSSFISNSNPNNVILLGWKDSKTQVLHQSNSLDVYSMQVLLHELGAKLSDVFGYDSIIWVEGPTEEFCYPILIKQLLKKSLRNIAIKALIHTGDFEKKGANFAIQLAVKIYKKLSNGNALIPPTVCFCFDREGRSNENINEIVKQFRVTDEPNKVFFTKRRLYENYLLNVEAITSILNKETYIEEDETEKNYSFSMQEIEDWIKNNKGNKMFWDGKKEPTLEQLNDWENQIDAAKFLQQLFNDKTEMRNPYQKTNHSIKLTEWLINYKVDYLEGLKNELLGVFKNLV